MDELEISGKRFISSKRAAKENRYHVDYIGQLIRSGKIVGSKVGRTWYVDAESLAAYLGKEKEAAPAAKVPPVIAIPAPQVGEPIKITKVEDVAVRIPVVSEQKPKLTYLTDDEPLPKIAAPQPVAVEPKIEPRVQPVFKTLDTAFPDTPRAEKPKNGSRYMLILAGIIVCGLVLGVSCLFSFTVSVQGTQNRGSISFTGIEK